MCSPARDFPLSRNYSPGAVSTETHSRSSSSNLPFQYEKEIVCLPGVEPCLEKYQHCRIGGPFILPCSEVVPLEEDLCIYDLISQNAPSKTPRSSLFPSRMEPPEILTFTFLEAHPGGFGGGGRSERAETVFDPPNPSWRGAHPGESPRTWAYSPLYCLSSWANFSKDRMSLRYWEYWSSEMASNLPRVFQQLRVRICPVTPPTQPIGQACQCQP